MGIIRITASSMVPLALDIAALVMGVLGVDFAITEYVLGITLPVIIVPKLKKYEVSGNFDFFN